MSEIKLCKDCRHCLPSAGAIAETLCMREAKELDLVSGGKDFTLAKRAYSQRYSVLDFECGKEARFWEPKE